MLIAIPVSNNKLDIHFGHCKEFVLIKIDLKNKEVLSRENINAPPHQPGLLPLWLAKLGVNLIIAGGMGHRAKELFLDNKIKVLVGAPVDFPEKLVDHYLHDRLELGENSCDH